MDLGRRRDHRVSKKDQTAREAIRINVVMRKEPKVLAPLALIMEVKFWVVMPSYSLS